MENFVFLVFVPGEKHENFLSMEIFLITVVQHSYKKILLVQVNRNPPMFEQILNREFQIKVYVEC